MEKLYMLGFDSVSRPDDTLCTDGTNFNINETFLLIANKPIPKHSKVYFEFTVNSYTRSTGKYNIPIYVGIHKEPAFGVLNSDFCVGSLFYATDKDYDIMSKYNKTALDLHNSPTDILTRLPGATDTIGVSVDYDNNLVSIYNNGKVFYTFSPELFKINEEENFYFCIWGNVASNLVGYVNFGKSGSSYLPTGYTTLYGEYYRQEESMGIISGSLTVTPDIIEESGDVIAGSIVTTNDIKGNGDIHLVSETATITDGLEYDLPTITTTNIDGGNIFCNLPIPVNQKIYLELYVKEGVCIDDTIIGIPASIGISGSIDEITTSSMRMPLYHKQRHNYIYTEVIDSNPHTTQISDVDTSITPEQGKLIGVCLDLANNEIGILIDKIPLYTFKAEYIDFRDPNKLAYLFLHDEGAYKNSIIGSFNFGVEPFVDNIPSGYISLHQYYNLFYLYGVDDGNNIISGTITVTPYSAPKAGYIYGTIIVPEDVDPNESNFPNLCINRVMKTYNRVTDVEPHQTVENDLQYLSALIKANNSDYTPDDV